MKKPIDPNLNNDQDDILLSVSFGNGKKGANEFGFDDAQQYDKKTSKDPNFKVTVVNEDKFSKPSNLTPKEIDESIDVNDILSQINGNDTSKKDNVDSLISAFEANLSSDDGETHHHHHHHHSSDGSHHHSHSGSHHHSSKSGSHHSHRNSDSHHSSSHHSSSHHSNSHHHHHHKKKKLPLPIRIVIAFLLIIVILIVSVLGAFFYLTTSGEKDLAPNMSEVSENYQETIKYKGHTYKYNEDVFSVAFMGVDQEEFREAGQTDFVGAADADIVLTVDKKTGKADVIAIPRDTMVDIDIYGQSGVFQRTETTQLCLAYSYSDGQEKSCVNTMNAMSRVLYDVPIQKYFALDLAGVPALNDAIGGVTVTSLYDLDEYGIKKGDEVNLKGDVAKAYVRTRDMDKVDASLNRVDRQVQYIKAYSQQVIPAVMKDLGTIQRLLDTADHYSQSNLILENYTYIASLMISKGVTEFETHTISGHMEAEPDEELSYVVHAQFYPDEDKLMETVLDVFYVQID